MRYLYQKREKQYLRYPFAVKIRAIFVFIINDKHLISSPFQFMKTPFQEMKTGFSQLRNNLNPNIGYL